MSAPPAWACQPWASSSREGFLGRHAPLPISFALDSVLPIREVPLR
jgi:hypothetical protein